MRTPLAPPGNSPDALHSCLSRMARHLQTVGYSFVPCPDLDEHTSATNISHQIPHQQRPCVKLQGVVKMDGSVRAGGEPAHGRMITAWDGHTASAEAAVPVCSVRVIKALDCSSGQYIVKEGVSAVGRMRRIRQGLACTSAREWNSARWRATRFLSAACACSFLLVISRSARSTAGSPRGQNN